MSTDRLTYFSDTRRVSAAELTYQISTDDAQGVRIAFSGEIDMSTSPEVDAAVAEALKSHRPRRVSIDLAEVPFIDSSGIHALVRCHARAAESGCRVAVTHLQQMTWRLLEITGLLATLADGREPVIVDGSAPLVRSIDMEHPAAGSARRDPIATRHAAREAANARRR